jgi:SAM-dependent methyltransferase
MKLKELEAHWDSLGRDDPLWAILSAPDKQGGRWDVDEFLATGTDAIQEVMDGAEDALPGFSRRRALDFGCGVGRLTQALCEHFEECDGVDIAESMVDFAGKINRHGSRCRYHVNHAHGLPLFADETFSFVYSGLVLQHIPKPYAAGYIRELFRVLEPGGLLAFQLPGDVIADQPASNELIEPVPTLLPGHACQAEVRVTSHPLTESGHLPMWAGSQALMEVEVENRSEVIWPVLGDEEGNFELKLVARWRGDPLRPPPNTDGQTILPTPMAPGQPVTVPLLAVAPAQPGRYELELDLIQEGVASFRSRGSRLPTLPVTAERRAAAPESDGASDEGEIQMYSTPRPRVMEILAQIDATPLKFVPNSLAGDRFTSFTYYVTKES